MAATAGEAAFDPGHRGFKDKALASDHCTLSEAQVDEILGKVGMDHSAFDAFLARADWDCLHFYDGFAHDLPWRDCWGNPPYSQARRAVLWAIQQWA